MKKWASKARGLKYYGNGKDVCEKEFWVQDGSWALFSGVRIYGHNSDNENTEICLSVNIKNANRLIKALKKFVQENKDIVYRMT